MKEIVRYKITSANGNSSNVTKCDDGHWVNYADVVDYIGWLHKTIHYLEKDKYELKDNVAYVEEGNIKLQARIKELESDKHINEIKAQGIDGAIKKADNETYIGIVGQEFPPQSQYKAELLCYAEQLRTKHE